MGKIKFLSEIEWSVLKIVWQRNKASVKDVWQELYPNGEKAYTTIQTYMDRLVKKKVLRKEKIGLVNSYQPALTEREALEQATESFVGRAFNGSFGLLAQFLVDSRNLSKEDLEKIKELIRKREESKP